MTMSPRSYLCAYGYAIVGAAILVLAAACSQAEGVRLGMSQHEVLRRLGEPDRKAVLDGKVLRELDDLAATHLVGYRLVYTYSESGIQVWFEADKVTGVTRHGVSIF